MQKQYFFLSGISRSGSTLLGSILNQNPNIYVSPTSPLLDLFCSTEDNLRKLTEQFTFDLAQVSPNIHNGLCESFYKHISKPYIIDKHRGWPKNVDSIKTTITANPKIICTYRPMAENITSFVELINNDPYNVVDIELTQNNKDLNTFNRAMWVWENYTSDTFYSLKYGLDNYRNHILPINYNNLVDHPLTELDRIYMFLSIPWYNDHYFDNITNTCSEQKDLEWGFNGLHNIRSHLTKISKDPEEVLGKDLVEYFNQFDNMLNI